jgi:site-specific DNA recombinase
MHERPGLLRLLDDAKQGKFDVVLVDTLIRLSRDPEELAVIYKTLTDCGVEIIAADDEGPVTPAHILRVKQSARPYD